MSAAELSPCPWHAPTLAAVNDWRQSGRLPHAIMLSGPEGLGKSLLARRMSGGLLCQADQDWPCGGCRSCQVLRGGAHPDRVHLGPEEGSDVIKVDQVRALIQTLSLTRTLAPQKVAVIDPADHLNRNAANALLKTLEEPLGDAVILLTVSQASRLPATINSRCRVLKLSQPQAVEAIDWLKENTAASDALASEALEAAGGLPLLALNLLQDDGLEDYRKLARDLGGRDGAVDLSQRWKDQRIWPWISHWMADLIRQASGGRSRFRRSADLGLDPHSVPRQSLFDLLQSAAESNRLWGTPVRQDLLMLEWLLQWRQLQHRARQNR